MLEMLTEQAHRWCGRAWWLAVDACDRPVQNEQSKLDGWGWTEPIRCDPYMMVIKKMPVATHLRGKSSGRTTNP